MPIQEHRYDDLSSFWQFITPGGELVRQIGATALPIFRGQGNASWDLIPSVLRPDVVEQYARRRSVYTQTDHIVFFERELLDAYIHHCDEMGLAIPGDSLDFRRNAEFFSFAEQFGLDGNEWPTDCFYPVLASAQHHGVPTRLLDMTKSSFVAAYFAGMQALNLPEKDSPQDIAIWAVDARKVDGVRHKTGNTINEIKFVSVPGVTSQNLAAQKGCFLLTKWLSGQSRHRDFERGPSVDEILNASEVVLHKVMLSFGHVGKLIFKCRDYGISAATLFPGYDGAGRAAREFKLAKRHSGVL